MRSADQPIPEETTVSQDDAPAVSAQADPVLTLNQLSVSFGGVCALDRVDFEVYPHEIVALVGENAAGKSTLAKVVAGVYHPSSGTILVDGREVTIGSPQAATRLGIATVFQELALADNLDVAANMFLGHEIHQGSVMRQAEMENAARQTLDEIGARIPSVRYPIAQLSAGQRQSVAIARALLIKPRIVILDEPTSRLSITQTAEVLELIVHLRDKGLGVVLISHNLADIQAVADRIVILRHGRVVASSPMAQVSYEDIVATMTGAAHTLPVPQAVRVSRLVGP
ncbi:MAG: ATP-binding cassette domain-containing protein [Propionibacteriaceae bacterium]|jgi:ABC-type sugar transport system ATPase subunit|nr:ATP-binding cassette domain-containing protein [Propionibacteriaceae bacterium]